MSILKRVLNLSVQTVISESVQVVIQEQISETTFDKYAHESMIAASPIYYREAYAALAGDACIAMDRDYLDERYEEEARELDAMVEELEDAVLEYEYHILILKSLHTAVGQTSLLL